jgi:hypothetical protein
MHSEKNFRSWSPWLRRRISDRCPFCHQQKGKIELENVVMDKNMIVYELYGITDEERKIIENGFLSY